MSGPFTGRAGSALVAAVLVSGCREAPPPPRTFTEVAVEVARLSDHFETVALTGDVAARVTSELSFRVGGRLLERRAEIGQHVGPDEILARIDREEQAATLDAAGAGVQAAEAQLRQALAAFERQRSLIRQGYTTRREFDASEEASRSAQGALDVARAGLGTAQDALAQTDLKAGVAGIVTARGAEAGQVVGAAQSVFTLAQDGPRDAVFNVYESLLARGGSDTVIRLALVSDPTVEATARLREVSPSVDPANGTVRVKFEIQDPPPAMTLGAAVTGTGRFKPRPAIVLPWSAMSADGGRPAVWIVHPGTKAVSLRPIAVEAFEVGRIVLRGGVKPGETVVTRGGQLLRPDQVVAPVDGSAS